MNTHLLMPFALLSYIFKSVFFSILGNRSLAKILCKPISGQAQFSASLMHTNTPL